MNEPLDELYLTWLYRQIGNPDVANASRTHWNLAKYLYTKEFIWFVPNDDNRVEDGRYLRVEFIEDLGLDVEDSDWMYMGCSMLELLVGMSRRLSFPNGEQDVYWFWHLIGNVGLRITDAKPFPTGMADEIVDKIIFRTYSRNGRGGFFPLRHPRVDQRDAELWYQLNAYLLERT